MPKRPKKPCAYPGCPNLVKPGERYCEEHRKMRYREYDRTKRDKESAKIYSSARWKRVREMKMKECGGLCEMCLKEGRIVKADVVDNIIELKDGGCAFCLDNLQCLCNSCHKKKTAQVQKARREGRV
jgi:5-methylcytosine-specific restriction protein A